MMVHFKEDDEMRLNRTLLSIILAVKDCKEFELSKFSLESCKFDDPYDSRNKYDWYENVEKYFYSIDDSLMSKAGIVKDTYTFERILSCKIPDEVYDTEYCDLGKFIVLI